MSRRLRFAKSVSALCGLSCALLGSAVFAAESETIEEIVVTGSYIKRTTQADSVSPITNIDRQAIDDTGILTSQELFRWLPSNTGSENQADSLTQGGTTGTSNVNLRGLGLGSTLVLIDGRRQTVSSASANGGDTFVDLNALVPFILVENIEVLKDGAAALYGSDAVAGVVNYKTRRDFEGFEIRGNFQSTTRSDDQQDRDISALFGAGNDKTHIVGALKLFERDGLFLGERDNLPRATTSGLGNPGSFVLLGPSPTFPDVPPGTTLADPLCETGTGSILVQTGPVSSACLFDFGPSFSIVPEEKRLGAYFIAEHSFSEYFNVFGEFGYARNEGSAGFSPSFPALDFPVIGADHPDNPFQVPVVALYRPLGDGLGEPGENRVVNTVDDTTQRFVFGANGSLGGSWSYDVAYTFSENERVSTGNDQVSSRLGLALDGFGGTACDPSLGTPGQNGCEFFNPFGTSLTAQPGEQGFNSPELLAFINSTNTTVENVDLVTWDAVVTGNLFELPGGTAGVAVGFQRREESRDTDRSEDAEREDLAFLFGGPDTSGEQDINAVFAEVFLPLVSDPGGHTLEAQLAVRYEDYDTGFDSTDPKIGLLYQYTDRFSARATWGTAFRAPTLFQLNNEVTALNASVDALQGPGAAAVFVGNTAAPNPDLIPEEATTFNVGFTVSPIDRLEISLDYYNVEYDDRLVQENGQAILSAETTALLDAGCTVATLNTAVCQALRDPAVVRDSNTGAVSRIFTERFNAASAETDGFDLAASYFFDSNIGTFGISNQTTFINSFELQAVEGGPTIEGAGFRNQESALANSIPEWRSNTNFSWSNDRHQANLIVRFISSYDERLAGETVSSVDSWTVLDAQYSYRFPVFDDNEASVTLGVLNFTDEDPPEVQGNLNEFGYDTKVHDARGAVWYARFVYTIP